MNFLNLILLLSFLGCSSTQNSKQKVKTRLVDGVTLPESVDAFLQMKQDDSVEYEIASFKAATDLVNLGKVQMESYNSGEALKYLALGSHLLPYRGDIKSLYIRAINNYVGVTNEMISSNDFLCSELISRIDFLKSISPDSVLALRKTKRDCPYEGVKDIDPFSFEKVTRLKQEKPALKYEKYADINLSSDLNYLLKMREYTPVIEILNIAIEGIGSVRLDSKNLKLSSQTRNSEDVTVEMDYEIIQTNEGKSSQETCKALNELLNIDAKISGKTTSGCWYYDNGVKSLEINTSDKVKSLFDNTWYHFFPSVLVYEVDFEYRNNYKRSFKYLSQRRIDFSTWDRFKDGDLQKKAEAEIFYFIPYEKDGIRSPSEYDKEFMQLYRYYRLGTSVYPDTGIRDRIIERKGSDIRFQMPALSTFQKSYLDEPKILIKRLKKDEIQDLVSIKISLDSVETYKFWRDAFKN